MLVAVLVLALSLVALPRSAAAESQIWTALTTQVHTDKSSGPTFWLDVQDRRRSDSTLAIVRPAVGYMFSPSLLAHLGYAWIPTVVDDGPNSYEQRTWQQVIGNHTVREDTKLQGRARFEQRFGSGNELAYRLRVMARGQVEPLSELPLQLVLSNELFLNFNTTNWTNAGFDQNRLFVGLGTDTKLSGLRFEVGYMGVYVNGPDRWDNILAINASFNHAL